MKKKYCLGALLLLLATTAFSAEPFNYAELWRSWNPITREAYITGAVDGIAEAYFTTISAVAPDKITRDPLPPEVRKATDKLFVRYAREQIGSVMTDLYKDPANAFVSTLNMFFLARDKIEGKDIAKGLMEARKSALDTHRLNEKMRSR
ncbi:MAG: hypothetical protein HY644_05980 [Acidobacteria bacterium]|nr:hypothetical protein [Acidobacteriota bacterium]